MLSKEKNNKKKKYRTALYYRLSKEDGDKIESDSISNQRLIIKKYLKSRDEFCVVDEYIDDGYSGANFDRPDFIRLYEDLKNGAVNCVIVKDLSRFGRNYIEVGRYLERLFPMMGVRLIAINDNYDGESEKKNSDAITIPVKNLLNDVYCREMSTKVKTLLDAKRKRGDCVSNFVPYGYKKSLKNRSKLEIDEDAAEVVKQIFVWKMQGISDQGIADNLNTSGILSPLEYRLESGQHFTENFKRNGTAVWNSKSVYRILHCETYTGTMVQGKNKKIDYRSKNIVRMPEKNWVRVADMHPAIIDKETYDKVQTLLLKDTRVAPGGNSVSILSGFVECGDCHGKMVYRTSKWKNKKYYYMICKTYKTDRSCSTHNISADKLYDIVLNEIRAQAEIAVRLESLMDEIEGLPLHSRYIKQLDGQMIKLQEDAERLERIKSKLYEDYSSGILTREDYLEYSEMYAAKILDRKNTMKQVAESRRTHLKERVESSWIATFKKYKEITELTRPIVVELINKIYVYENGRVEILFYFQDELNETIELAEQYIGESEEIISENDTSEELLIAGGIVNGD